MNKEEVKLYEKWSTNGSLKNTLGILCVLNKIYHVLF